MKFKSPVVELRMARLSQSIAGGILIPAFLGFVLLLTDTGDSMRPLLERHPSAYILVWPLMFWKHVLPSEKALLATAASHFIIYSLLTYQLVRWYENLKPLR
jgi:hypothetical protein